MFDALRNVAGFAGIMKDLPRIKARIDEIKRDLEQRTVEAETGAGAVKAVANGKLRIVSIEVNKALIAGLVEVGNDDDLRLAEDLVAGAVNAALEKAQEMVTAELAAAAQELNLPLPPGGLGELLG